MGSHRADRRGPRRRSSGSPTPSQPVSQAATTDVVPTQQAGKRRAAGHAGSRGSLFPLLPSPPVLAGIAVLAASVGGAVVSTTHGPTVDAVVATSASGSLHQPGAMTGTSKAADANLVAGRTQVVSRGGGRDASAEGTDAKLVAKAEDAAKVRNQALAALGKAAEAQSAKIKANLWVLPVASYRLTAGFGQSSYLWSSVHTGLDFAAPSGTPIMSIARGVVTEVGYDGAYGNKTVVTLDDGTEIWYCHQTSYAVSVGETVGQGEVIGYIGSTGNTTGPHLHLEVHPGAGDPVDPYAALVAHGVTP
ncbi:M23 family metallopeptidase [Nocardioides sp.]|uniref:M23 family metallopeptidase n=1 Tax=Nocardioides sp. TaxID=35761 RepID=UPI0035284CAF